MKRNRAFRKAAALILAAAIADIDGTYELYAEEACGIDVVLKVEDEDVDDGSADGCVEIEICIL